MIDTIGNAKTMGDISYPRGLKWQLVTKNVKAKKLGDLLARIQEELHSFQ